MPIFLASASPRRSELLTQAGFTFTVRPSHIQERITEASPDKMAEELAFQKADDVYKALRKEGMTDDFLVIGADTLVYYNGEILGKPKDAQEAFDLLKLLSDRTHQVWTGIAVIERSGGTKQIRIFHERTDVTFYPIPDEDLRAYIATGDCMDKAGAYGIQGPFAVHVREIRGDYNNVVGLPIAKLYQTLRG
ncbi:MAG: septum formation protein Maf [Lachnospiraceae bacterium]|nr:septum formation protein Maf [Lachnospiraceae bacterium]